jgi:integrase
MLAEKMRRVPLKKAGLGWIELRFQRNEISPKQKREYTRQIDTLDRIFKGKQLPLITETDVRDFQYKRSQEVYRTKPDGTVILVGRNSINKEGNLLCQLRTYIGMPFGTKRHPSSTGSFYDPIRKKRGEKKRVGRALTDDEREFLFEVAKAGPKDWWVAVLFAKVALNTSARPGEVTGATGGIQLFDINLQERVVHIRGTKTDKSDRWEPLNDEAFEAVVEAIERLKSLTKHLGPVQPEWYLFPFFNQKTRKHDPTKSQRSIRRAWEKLRSAAGLPWLRPNDLRHTVASAMAHDPQTSQEDTKEIMGHETVKMTEHYQHLEMKKKRAAFDRLLRRKVNYPAERASPGTAEKKPPESVVDDSQVASLGTALSQLATTQLQIAQTLAQMQSK